MILSICVDDEFGAMSSILLYSLISDIRKKSELRDSEPVGQYLGVDFTVDPQHGSAD